MIRVLPALAAGLLLVAGTAATNASAPANTRLPAIAGNARSGSVLVASNGDWAGSPTSYAYQWQRCDTAGGGCVPIAGADSVRYTAASADVGHRLRVVVTATNSAGSGSAASRPTAAVSATGHAPVATRLPSLSGTPQQGATLSVDRGDWSGTRPIHFDFSWQRCDSTGNNCSTFIVHSHVRAYNAPDQPTDANGWATITIQPTRNMPLRPGDLVLFVRARKPGDNLLAGVSTRRLVQAAIR